MICEMFCLLPFEPEVTMFDSLFQLGIDLWVMPPALLIASYSV